MPWKTTLYDYVHHRNQADLDCTVESMYPYVSDSHYLDMRSRLLARRAEEDASRAFSPYKSETRLAVLRTVRRGEAIVADIAMKRTAIGMIRHEELEEQRIERERITLEPLEDRWLVTKIEPLDNELGLVVKPAGVGALPEADGAFAADGLMRAPSVPYLNPGMLPAMQIGARVSFDRGKAVEYADKWWNGSNPAYLHFEVDCTNYVSQCLFAGGAPMNYTGRRDSGWWYRGRSGGRELWSYSWAVAGSLQFYLLTSRSGLRAREVEDPRQLAPGDVISYDWDGNGRYRHSTIVTAKDGNGMPLVNAHTVSSRRRYWSYKDSPAWTDNTRYRFLHIADTL